MTNKLLISGLFLFTSLAAMEAPPQPFHEPIHLKPLSVQCKNWHRLARKRNISDQLIVNIDTTFNQTMGFAQVFQNRGQLNVSDLLRDGAAQLLKAYYRAKAANKYSESYKPKKFKHHAEKINFHLAQAKGLIRAARRIDGQKEPLLALQLMQRPKNT